MSIRTVVTRGFGTWSSPQYVVTAGYGLHNTDAADGHVDAAELSVPFIQEAELATPFVDAAELDSK